MHGISMKAISVIMTMNFMPIRTIIGRKSIPRHKLLITTCQMPILVLIPIKLNLSTLLLRSHSLLT